LYQIFVRGKAWFSRIQSRKKRSHKVRQDAAIRRLQTFQEIQGATESETFARRIGYLRKIDPLVFEEWTLDAFAKIGWTVMRNERYSGDGGIDGKIYHKDHGWCGIQCKRYKDAIKREHVEKFAKDLQSNGFSHGYFVHTGRTPSSVEKASPMVTIVSGQKLVDLLLSTTPKH